MANATSLPVLWPAADPWEGATEIVLFDGDAEAIDCQVVGGGGDAELATASCTGGEIPIGDGPFIPEGTLVLRVEADATDALKAGSYHAYLNTMGRDVFLEANGERSGEPVHTWQFVLTPLDWDYAYREATSADLGFWASGDGPNVLQGAIRAKVTAVRDPDWEPAPVLDVWEANGTRLAAPGVILLADVNATWNGPSPADNFAGAMELPEAIPLAAIPPGTTSLVMALTWVETSCPEGHECAPNPRVVRGNVYQPPGEMERTPTYVLVTYEVPTDLPDDGPNATAGGAIIRPFVYRCAEALDPTGLGCFASFYALSVSIDVRVRVEAWRGDPDLDAVKARMGIGG